MKKLILILAVALTGLIFTKAKAQTEIASGYCGAQGDGTNLTWRLTTDNVLTISGSGAMKNYDNYYDPAPWRSAYVNKMKTLVIGDSVTTVGDYAFYNCNALTGILNLPNSITTIGELAFNGCRGFSETLIIPNSVVTVKRAAFNRCSGLTDIIFSDSMTVIEDNVFNGCSGLTGTLVIPNHITRIEQYAFWRCHGLTSIIIGDTTSDKMTMHIESSAFQECGGLKSVYIGSSVSGIEFWAFRQCSSLTDVYVFWTTPISIGSDLFIGLLLFNIRLHIPEGTLSAYLNAPVWQDFSFPSLSEIETSISMGSSIYEWGYSFIIEWEPVVNASKYMLIVRDIYFEREHYSAYEKLREYFTDNHIYIEDGFSINYDYCYTLTAYDAQNNIIARKTENINFDQFSSVEQIKEASSLIIYPNPAIDELNISMAEGQIKAIEILDISGKVVMRFSGNKNRIDVCDLQQGIYILKAQTDKGVITKKFIKK